MHHILRRSASGAVVAALLFNTNAAIASSLHSARSAVVGRVGLQDVGRAATSQPVSIALTLKYRNETELEELIALQTDSRSRVFHRFLTNAQFEQYFAPSQADYDRTVVALRRAGFAIARLYENRTLIDARATAGVAERFFRTRIDRFVQSGAGVRYANVFPVVLPLDTLATASLSNVIHVRPAYQFAAKGSIRPANRSVPVNVVKDGGFESGGYVSWKQSCPQAASADPGSIVTQLPHAGKYDAFMGVTAAYQFAGPSYICQLVTIPRSASLSFYVRKSAVPGTNTVFAYQTATLVDPFGFPLQTFYTTATNSDGYVLQTYGVNASLAGRQAMLSFGTYNDGSPNFLSQRVDDVALTGDAVPTPVPSPTREPTPRPTATPTARPTASPTARPTASPTARPTASPSAVPTGKPTATAKPTSTPVPSPTPKPTATPVPTPAPTGTVGGSLFGPDGGYGPVAVAQGYDLPVQHGFTGAGRSTGIEIDADYANSDLTTYLNYFNIKRTGSVVREAVDGGPTGQSSDSIETTLDVETIAANAPGTNIVVYEIPDLSDQSIEDGYNQEVSDNKVDIVNSSFGGCEIGDTTFATATNQIAQQGAAKGITFSASSGDQGADCQNGPLSAESPSADPYFVGAGGTTLSVNADGSYHGETAWSGSGGGVSTVFALPAYQQGISGMASSSKRNVPDIAFASDPNSGTAFYYQGAWEGPLGGTSWASPIFCALQTEIDQRLKSRAGLVNSALYKTFTSDGSAAFHDITSGGNGGYSAHAGYDNVTGIGSARGYFLSGVE